MRLLTGHWQLWLLGIAVVLFWQTPYLLPLKLLVVFFHEAAHALMTVVTGGEVVRLDLSAGQGGTVISRGGNRFAILNAGYLGSLLAGVLLLMAAARSRADRTVMGGLGLLVLLLAALYIRTGFALIFALGTGAAMLAAARFLSHTVNDLILRLIGLTSIIYVPLDIFSDTIARSALNSDARMLAQEFGGTTQLWGVIWLVISALVIGWTLRHLMRRSSNVIPR